MQRDYKIYAEDIVEAIEKIETYTMGMSYEEFEENQLVTDAVVRNLEIVGEAVKNIPEEIKKEHRDIPWKKIADLRNIISHKYFGIDQKIIWEIIQTKLSSLKEAAHKMI